jgi:photosystem II stability/assembly factor-like uncharacterized protein
MARCRATPVLLLAGAAISCRSADRSIAFQGPTWEVQVADSTTRFIGLFAVDSQTVWAAGARGRVGRTTDGGATWTLMTVPGADSLEFRDVHAFSGREAFVLSIGNGPASRIYRTRDGGVTWDRSFQNDDPNAFFDCFSFWSAERGFAFSDSHAGEFVVIHTTDGGDSWSRIAPELLPDARDGEGAFASSGTCVVTRPGGLGWFVTGASGVDTRVIRTTDYGATWFEAPTPIASDTSLAGIFSLTMLDDRAGAAFGGSLAYPDSLFDDVALTADGGATWTLGGRTGLGGAVYGASYVPGAATPTLVAVSPKGSAFSTDHGRTWTGFDTVSYWAVSFVSPRAGWAVGPGRIGRIALDVRE